MSTGENLIKHLIDDSNVAAVIADRAFQNVVPAEDALPYVWLMRRGTGDAGTLEAEDVPYLEYFDVECVALGVDEAVDLAELVRTSLNGQQGTLGDGLVQWVEVRDQSDDYVPRNVDADERLSVASLDLEVTNL